MCYYLVISQRPVKIAQLCSIKARPTLSINEAAFAPAFKDSPLSGFNGSQKFEPQQIQGVPVEEYIYILTKI